MAEILIKAVSASHPDPEKDRRGCYKAGMPVVVAEDGHQWGRAEGLPQFFLLKLPGVSVEKVQSFIDPDVETTIDPVSGEPEVKTNARRLWRIHVEDIPAAALEKLQTTGEITIGVGMDFSWTQFRNFLKNRRTLGTAPLFLR